MTNKVDIEKELRFPLLPIPTSMCHADGISVDAQVVVHCSDSDILIKTAWQYGSSECIFEALVPMGRRKP
ncbi:hypothetical protein TNCV_1544971 [Trichonephila clavipes]|nr:hypothetical protein TNCV_1544971 [Trichonephila clavipes]